MREEKATFSNSCLQISTLDDSMVQELQLMLFKSFVLTMQRLLLYRLPGGVHHAVSDQNIVKETESVPTTNVNPERGFAVLDRMMSEKPNATCIALESLLLFSHNKVWLNTKSVEEKERLLRAARTLTSVHKANFRKRREEIVTKRQEGVQRKEQEVKRKKEKERKKRKSLLNRFRNYAYGPHWLKWKRD